jgi:hypothetical protein
LGLGARNTCLSSTYLPKVSGSERYDGLTASTTTDFSLFTDNLQQDVLDYQIEFAIAFGYRASFLSVTCRQADWQIQNLTVLASSHFFGRRKGEKWQ